MVNRKVPWPVDFNIDNVKDRALFNKGAFYYRSGIEDQSELPTNDMLTLQGWVYQKRLHEIMGTDPIEVGVPQIDIELISTFDSREDVLEYWENHKKDMKKKKGKVKGQSKGSSTRVETKAKAKTKQSRSKAKLKPRTKKSRSRPTFEFKPGDFK